MWMPDQPLRDTITGERVIFLDLFFDPEEKKIISLVQKENGETIAFFNTVDCYIEEFKFLGLPNPYLTPEQRAYLENNPL